ncbi:MAG: hypothetical protein HYU88_08995 [Chloroflexi bacterium]|nr:hypothetical protein [Chloroflexota bacterium]
MSERLDREIQEILARFDDRGSRRRRPSGLQRLLGQLRAWFWGTGWDISPERLLTTAVALIVAAFIVGRLVPRLGAYLAIVAVVLFAASILFSVTGWHRPRHEKRWRGRVVEHPARGGFDLSALLRRLRRWFR